MTVLSELDHGHRWLGVVNDPAAWGVNSTLCKAKEFLVDLDQALEDANAETSDDDPFDAPDSDDE